MGVEDGDEEAAQGLLGETGAVPKQRIPGRMASLASILQHHRLAFLVRSTKVPLRLFAYVSFILVTLIILLSTQTSSIDIFKAWTADHLPFNGLHAPSRAQQASARLMSLQQNLTRKHLEEDVVIKNLGDQYDLPAYQARIKKIYEQYFAPQEQSTQPDGRYRDVWKGVEEYLTLAPPAKKREEGMTQFITSSARNSSDLPKSFKSWYKDHPDWDAKVYEDIDIDQYIRRLSAVLGRGTPQSSMNGRGDFYNEWLHMPYPILRIDTFRYLRVFLDGGVYSDSDTGSLYPINEWPGMTGPHEKVVDKHDAILHDLEATRSWTPPGLVLAVEYDAPGKNKKWKELKLARPLQITQFAFLAKPFHPVLLDCLGSIMDSAAHYNASLIATQGTEFMNLILDWTGPGLFTDAVNRYLVARYGVDPFVFAGLDDKAARIGDVLIYPEFAFGIDFQHHLSKDFELIHHGFLHRWIDHFYDG